jgi:hypothetical protein
MSDNSLVKPSCRLFETGIEAEDLSSNSGKGSALSVDLIPKFIGAGRSDLKHLGCICMEWG